MSRCHGWLRRLAIACCLALLPRCAHESRHAPSSASHGNSSQSRSHTGSRDNANGSVAGELALGLLGAIFSSLLESDGGASEDDGHSGPDVAPLTATFDAREEAETFLGALPVPCILDEERLEHIRASAAQSGVTLAITPGHPAGSAPCSLLPSADGHYSVLFGLEQRLGP